MINKIAILISVLTLAACSEKVQQQDNNITDEKPLSATGELISLDSATISPPSVRGMWQYKLQYLIKENSQVNKGDVVVRLDGQDLRNKLLDKQSALDAAIKEQEQEELAQDQKGEDLKLSLAEANMFYDKEKRKSEIVDAATSEIDRQKQQKQFEIASSKLAQAQQKLAQFKTSRKVNNVVSQSKIRSLTAKVAEIEADIKRLSIKAPKSGVVMYVTNHDGEKAAVGETLWQGQSILTIPSLDKMAVRAEFDEPDSAKLGVGSKVKVMLDSYPELPFMGEISALGQSYRSKSNQNPKVVFDAFIQLETIDPKLMRPGMQTKVEVINNMSEAQ